VTTFPVYRYVRQVGQKYERLLSFCGDDPNRVKVGDVHAPDGSSMLRRSGIVWIAVPKPNVLLETWLLTAEEAVADGRDHKRGLRWEPAAEGVAR
jgi:hypothetical protein